MTTPGSLRRVVVTTTLGSLSIAALMGVLALLGSGDFGEGQARVLGTTLLVGLSSIAVLCYLATSETDYQSVGVVGGFAVLLPLFTGLWLIWADYSGGDHDAIWKAFGVGIVAASTLAQASLLLGLAGANRSVRPLLLATLAAAGVLGLLVSFVILGGDDNGDGLWRVIGIVAILDVLGTVVVIALGVVGRIGGAPSAVGSTSGSSPRVSSTGIVTVALPGPLAAGLDERSRQTGRARDDLVAEAVARYLGSHTEPRTQSGM